MFRILILSNQTEYAQNICNQLRQEGYSCDVAAVDESASNIVATNNPDLVIIVHQSVYSISELSYSIKEQLELSVLAIIDSDVLSRIKEHFNYVDDFIVKPFQFAEVLLRTNRLLLKLDQSKSKELLICGDLKIDLARCEVLVANRIVPLTFKEYELLKFLVNNKEKVFNRDLLLNKVWGYDYYGGDRTVDVHIRRLRSKLEDAEHSFIETVRNIGYRFRCDN